MPRGTKKRRVAVTDDGYNSSVRNTPIPVAHSGLQFFEPPRVSTSVSRGYTEETFSKLLLMDQHLT